MTSYDAFAIDAFSNFEITVARSWPKGHVTANPKYITLTLMWAWLLEPITAD